MYWCNDCQIWQHEQCLVNFIRKEFLNLNPSIITWQKSHKALGMNIEISIFVNKESGGVNAHISKKPLQRQEAIGDLSTEIEEIGGI